MVLHIQKRKDFPVFHLIAKASVEAPAQTPVFADPLDRFLSSRKHNPPVISMRSLAIQMKYDRAVHNCAHGGLVLEVLRESFRWSPTSRAIQVSVSTATANSETGKL